MKLRSFLSKLKSHRGFQFLLDLSTGLLAACFIFLLTPLFMDYVTDAVSFGLGFFFCMIADCIFAILSHHLKKAYFYYRFGQQLDPHFIICSEQQDEQF